MAKKRLISPQVDTYETDLSYGLGLPKANIRVIGSSGISTPTGGRPNPINPIQPILCTATPYSQGYDNTVQYAYNMVLVNGIQERKAYVECGYFE
jgi:hypothetical protein